MPLGLGPLSRGSTISADNSIDNSTAESDSANVEERFSTMSISDESGPMITRPTTLANPLLSTETEPLASGTEPLQVGKLARQESDQAVLWEMPTEEALASMYDESAEPAAQRPSSAPRRDTQVWGPGQDGGSQQAEMWTKRPGYVGAEMWKHGNPGFPQQAYGNYPRPRNNGPKEVPEHLVGRRLRGKALWFANKMGFGFIQHEGNDYFVHYTDIEMKGWRSLSPDDEVEFELEKQKGRLKAVRVTGPGGKMRERPKGEQRAIKVCAQDLKGLCRRGASCRFTHVAELQRDMHRPPMHMHSPAHHHHMHHREAMPYMPHMGY